MCVLGNCNTGHDSLSHIFLDLPDRSLNLKVPKRENFELAFFTLSDPIWEGDLGTEAKNRFVSGSVHP
jgi:hypothetical protein